MIDHSNEQKEIKVGSTEPQAMQVNVRMQQGEHTGQGVVMVDFGFIDPQTMQLLNQKIASGKRVSDTINAKCLAGWQSVSMQQIGCRSS